LTTARWLALVPLLGGCHLVLPHRPAVASGPDAGAGDGPAGESVGRDRWFSEGFPADRGSDGARVDARSFRPISPEDLKVAWAATTVPCIDEKGVLVGTGPISILGSLVQLAFVDGAVTLASAGAETKAWAGAAPAVTVIFDPVACGIEDAFNGAGSDGEWAEAGLLIRGATLDTEKRLLLAAGTTTADLNVLDISSSGAFEGETFGADDAGLSAYPNAKGTVDAAKQKLLELATAP
jgi:hypothetical protein